MSEPTGNTRSDLLSQLRFVTISVLLVIAVVFLVIDHFWPRNTVDQKTVDQMDQVVTQMKEISKAINASTIQLNQSNQKLDLILSRRGGDRETLYSDMLDRYDPTGALRLQPQNNGVGSQHPAASRDTKNATQ